MLEQFVCPQVVDLQPYIIYQQDGAPPHLSVHVRESLMRTFPDRWIGCDGPISWPPRSHHSLDFFFWGYVKDRVYATHVSDLLTLRDRICDVTTSVTWTCWTEHGKKLSTDLTLFVPPVGHMLKCTKLTTATQIICVPLSYTSNCIHLAFTVFSQWWIEVWEVWKGHPVHWFQWREGIGNVIVWTWDTSCLCLSFGRMELQYSG
jgi:hypothetical protein